MKTPLKAQKLLTHNEACGCGSTSCSSREKQGSHPGKCSCEHCREQQQGAACCNQNAESEKSEGCSCCHDHEQGDEESDAHSCGHGHEDGDGCDCGHDHEHSDEKFRKTDWIAIGLMALAFFFKTTEYAYFYAPLFIVAYLFVAFKQIVLAVRNTLRGEIFDENFLMTIATLGALIIKDYPEAIVVIVFYRIGEYFQSKAISKSKKSIRSLLEIKSETANLLQGEQVTVVSPEALKAGDLILIKAGERIPVDGIVIKGKSSINMAALTGEALPVLVEEDDNLLSGSLNIDGTLTVRVVKLASESTASKIMELVENASKAKAKTEQFITKFAKIYTPTVMLLSALTGFVSYFAIGRTVSESIYYSMIFLVISCPCALVISVPLGFFGGIGASSTKGVLVKGGNYLEALSEVKEIVFDKTGTLTKGILEVSHIFAKDISEEELIEIAAVAERNSNHPIAKAILNRSTGKYSSTETYEYAGRGIECTFEKGTVLVGNDKLLTEKGIPFTSVQASGTSIYVALNNQFVGQIMAKDTIKPEAPQVIGELINRGIKVTMLTGDREESAREIAEQIGITNVYSSLLPGDKVEKLKSILSALNKGEKVAAVGDGINDAPLLTLAHIGISMGNLGSDAAIEASDIVLMQDKLTGILTALDISKMTRAVVRQNIILSIVVKAVVMIAAALGYGSIWLAIFADVGVAIIAILNAAKLALKK